jgi:hypothetical protein
MTGASQQGSPSIRLGRCEVSDQLEPSWRVWEDRRLLAPRGCGPKCREPSMTLGDGACFLYRSRILRGPLPYFLPHASPPGSARDPIPSVARKCSPLTPTCWAIDYWAAHSCAGVVSRFFSGSSARLRFSSGRFADRTAARRYSRGVLGVVVRDRAV